MIKSRGSRGDPHAIDAAKDRILKGKSASSCAFMDPRQPANDPVTLAYRRDFGLDAPLSDDVLHPRVTSSK